MRVGFPQTESARRFGISLEGPAGRPSSPDAYLPGCFTLTEKPPGPGLANVVFS
jgi:hypothetical protein